MMFTGSPHAMELSEVINSLCFNRMNQLVKPKLTV